MSQARPVRYGDVAVGLHWLIALLIISLLAVGKFMTGLDEGDPLRFTLTQWHKTFGITVLLLVIVRLLWRCTHRAPAHPANSPLWEKRAAGITHTAFYVLMFAVPITGWIMVSASPLNIDTRLFTVIPWPHLPPFPSLPEKGEIAEAFAWYHELAGNILLILLILHVGAALKHHLIDKDDVLKRMAPDWASRAFRRKLQAFSLAVVVAGVGIWQLAVSGSASKPLLAGASQVSFIADVSGEDTAGTFAESEVTIVLDDTDLANSSIVALVQTSSVSSDDSQVDGSLPDKDWFDVQNHPEALFESTLIEAAGDASYRVTGNLTMKGITQPVSFPMVLETIDGKRVATGSFAVQRLDYNIGSESQPNDDSVGFEVIIQFQFDIQAADS